MTGLQVLDRNDVDKGPGCRNGFGVEWHESVGLELGQGQVLGPVGVVPAQGARDLLCGLLQDAVSEQPDSQASAR